MSSLDDHHRWLLGAVIFVGGLGLVAIWFAPEGPPSDATKTEARVDSAPAKKSSSSVETGFPDKMPDPPPADDAPSKVDLTGTWAHRSVQTSLTDVPIGGQVTSRTITYRVTEIRQDGSQIDLRAEVCDTKITSNSKAVKTIVPRAFVDTIPVAERRGRLERASGAPTLQIDRSCGVRGANLEKPEGDKLPTSPNDDRVVDEDGDGHPGVTIRLKGTVSGDIYLVQRGCDAFDGRILSNDHVRGTVDWSTEQEVLGSNSMFLKSKPSSKPHSEPKRSWFEMRRVDGDLTCEQLMEKPGAFFE